MRLLADDLCACVRASVAPVAAAVDQQTTYTITPTFLFAVSTSLLLVRTIVVRSPFTHRFTYAWSLNRFFARTETKHKIFQQCHVVRVRLQPKSNPQNLHASLVF